MSDVKDFYFKIIHHGKNVLIACCTEASGEIALVMFFICQGRLINLIEHECKNI